MATEARYNENLVFFELRDEVEEQFFMLHGYKIVTGHLGGQRTAGIWITLDDSEKAKSIRNLLNNEKKKEEREERCIIKNKQGTTTRCPESNHCSACPHCRTGKPLSLDLELENKTDKFHDARAEFEEDVVMTMLARELMEHVHNLGGKHAKVMAALINGTSVRTFAEENKIGKSTAQDWFDQFKDMARDFLGE